MAHEAFFDDTTVDATERLTDMIPTTNLSETFFHPIAYSPISHHALGSGSYVYIQDFAPYLQSMLPAPNELTEITIVLQPNSSPHVATICNLILAFVTARRLQDIGQEVLVRCDILDQAERKEVVIDNVKYQRRARTPEHPLPYLPDYQSILELLSAQYQVPCAICWEADVFRQPLMVDVIRYVIQNRAELFRSMTPPTDTLAFRFPCPTCGLIDKDGFNNTYTSDSESISFVCPHHGVFSCDVQRDSGWLQFDSQLRNLIMVLYYARIRCNWIEICGSDFPALWLDPQFRTLQTKPATVVYAPLIMDWWGLRLSESSNLTADAYKHVQDMGQEYLLNYDVFRREGRNLEVLYREIELWVADPQWWFRNYTVDNLHALFEQDHNLHEDVMTWFQSLESSERESIFWKFWRYITGSGDFAFTMTS